MSSLPARPRVAIVNTSDDLVQILKEILEEEGYKVATATVRVFRMNQERIAGFIEAHDPQVLVWDIAIPYEENWRYFQGIKASPCMQGRRFVLMSTNEQRVREVIGMEEEIIEIVGKPFDLQQLIEAVARALAAPE